MLLDNNADNSSDKPSSKATLISCPRTIIHNSTVHGTGNEQWVRLPKVNLIHPLIPSHKALHKDRYLLYVNPDAPSLLFGKSVESGDAVVTQDDMSVFFPQSTALITRAKAALSDDYYQRKYGRGLTVARRGRSGTGRYKRWLRRFSNERKTPFNFGNVSATEDSALVGVTEGSVGKRRSSVRLTAAKAIVGGDAAAITAAATGIQTHDRPWLIQTHPREANEVEGGNFNQNGSDRGGGVAVVAGDTTVISGKNKPLANNNNFLTKEERRSSAYDINKAKSYRFESAVMLERRLRKLNCHLVKNVPQSVANGGKRGDADGVLRHRCKLCHSANCGGAQEFSSPPIVTDSVGVVPICTHRVPLTTDPKASLSSLSREQLRAFINEKLSLSEDYYCNAPPQGKPQATGSTRGSKSRKVPTLGFDGSRKNETVLKEQIHGTGTKAKASVTEHGDTEYDEEKRREIEDKIDDLSEVANYNYNKSYKEILSNGGGIRDILERQVEDQIEPVWFKNSVKKRIYSAKRS